MQGRRHSVGMRSAWTIAFLLAGVLWADEAADRRAIEGIIERLNFTGDRAAVFADGVDVPGELHRLERAGCLTTGSVWSEVPSPRFTRPAVQFITADVALADFEFLRHSSLTAAAHTPIVAILKRQRGEWKIVTLRVTEACAGELRVLPVGH